MITFHMNIMITSLYYKFKLKLKNNFNLCNKFKIDQFFINHVSCVTFLTVVQIIDYGREQCSGGNCPTTTKTGNASREFLLPARQPSLLQTSNKQHIVL